MFLTNFADPKEANQGPVSAIQEAFDQNEGKQEEESLDEAKPMGNNAQLVDAIEVEVEGESQSSYIKMVNQNPSYRIHLACKFPPQLFLLIFGMVLKQLSVCQKKFHVFD